MTRVIDTKNLRTGYVCWANRLIYWHNGTTSRDTDIYDRGYVLQKGKGSHTF